MFHVIYIILLFVTSVFAVKRKLTPISVLRNGNSPYSLRESRFIDFIWKKSRDYDIFSLFISNDPDHMCYRCEEAVMYYSAVSNMYRANVKKEEQDHFFGICDFEEGEDIFKMLNITEIPMIVFYPRYMDPTDKSQDFSEYTYILGDGDIGEMVNWVIEMAGIDMKSQYEDSEYEGDDKVVPNVHFFSILFTILYALLICYFSTIKRTFCELYQSPKVYRIFTLIIYYISIAGIVSCIINNPPWYSINPYTDKWYEKYMFVSNDGFQQYVIEGFIAAALICIIAIGMFLVCKMHLDKNNSDGLLKIEYTLMLLIIMLYTYSMLNEFTYEKLMSGEEEEGLEE